MTDAEHVPVDIHETFSQWLPPNSDSETKRTFARFCLDNYTSQAWKGSSLSEFFADDFNEFTIEDFRSIDANIRRNLRDHLRLNGVYVPKGRTIQIANALHAVVDNHLEWPENDPDKPSESWENTDGRNIASGPINPIQAHQRDGSSEGTNSRSTAPENRGDEENQNQTTRRCNLSSLFKAYSGNADRYSGSTTDNFERKFAIFHEKCDKSDITGEKRRKAFSIMLCSAASQYYFDHLQGKDLSLQEMAKRLSKRFQTGERTRALLREWESLSLPYVINQNLGKPATDCLELLVNRLAEIQVCLPMEYRNDTIFKNKLLNAVKDVESCRLAYQKTC